jgi:beta-galactosidase GanA
MKSAIFLFILCCLIAFQAKAQSSAWGIPQIKYQGDYAELMVDGKPLLMTAGELGNSSASSMAYMEPIWPKVEKMHLNTLIAPVYWELMEPTEGKFNFVLVDYLIKSARKHHIKLVLLWFGTWKNSMGCYAPAWIKTEQKRFPRVLSNQGISQEIISPFSDNALTADVKAYGSLIRHIKQTDGAQHTVVMIQVENEIGMLPSARDHSKPADMVFDQPVPETLINYLNAHREKLYPEIKNIWQNAGFKTSGNWETVFGKGPATDELFMAWYFATYANAVARAGKAIYPIPMYVNAALNAPGKLPGQYPSGGPLPHLIDVWKAGAPAIDLLCPDFYNPNFKYWSDRYARPDNALFIPEHRFEQGVDAKAFYAIGHYKAIGFSPFSIESGNQTEVVSLGKSYDIIHQLSGEISKARKKGLMEGVLLSKDIDTVQLQMGDYILTVSHDLTLGWSPKVKDTNWPLTGGIIIALSKDEFYVGGTGLVISFKPIKQMLRAGIQSVNEGSFVNGKWHAGRRLNGDEDHQGRHLRIPTGEYGIQRIKLYTYE